MKTYPAIWKYPLAVADDVTVEMPVGAEILTVQTQNDAPCLWAKVNTAADVAKESRHLRIVGTGHLVPDAAHGQLVYIGSFQMLGGQFVGHVFEDRKP